MQPSPARDGSAFRARVHRSRVSPPERSGPAGARSPDAPAPQAHMRESPADSGAPFRKQAGALFSRVSRSLRSHSVLDRRAYVIWRSCLRTDKGTASVSAYTGVAHDGGPLRHLVSHERAE